MKWRSLSNALRGQLRRLARARWTEPFRRDWLTATASVVTVIFLPLVILQLWDLSEQRALRGLQVAMSIDQQLNSGSAAKIRYAIRSRKPILSDNGGPFTRDELLDYLNIFEGLSDAYEIGQIDRETLFLWHGTPIARA